MECCRMSKIKFKRFKKTLDELEKEINMYLESDEGSQFEVLNISIGQNRRT